MRRRTIGNIKLLTKRAFYATCRFILFIFAKTIIFLRYVWGLFVTNPLSAIKNFGAALGITALVYYTGMHVFSTQVFIDDVELQAGVQGLGEDGASITKAALEAIPDEIDRRIGQLPHSPDLGELVERYSDTHATEHYCNFQIPIVSTNFDIYKWGIDRARMSSTIPDKVISKDTFSLKKIAYDLRPKLGLDTAREIKPILFKSGEKFVLSLKSSPLGLADRRKEFEDIKSANFALANLLIDYLSPEVMATEFLLNGETQLSNFQFPFQVAEIFLKDKQKQLYVLNVFASSQLERSRSNASVIGEYIRFEPINLKLLTETDFTRYGDHAVLVKAGIADRLMQLELARIQASDRKPDLRELHEKHFGSLKGELQRTDAGRFLLVIMAMRAGAIDQFNTYLEMILSDSAVAEARRPQRQYVMLALISGLVAMEGKFEEAEKLLKRLKPSDADKAAAVAGVTDLVTATRSIIAAYRGDLSAYRAIASGATKIAPCFDMLAADALHRMSFRGVIKADVKDEANEIAAQIFRRIEGGGIKNFAFFNSGGSIERAARNYKKAYKHYESALSYEGDHAWALLNWGWGAFDEQNLSLARDRFEKSLELAAIPEAVRGYLATLWKQGDDRSYVAAFRKYASSLASFPHAYRSDFEMFAMASTCAETGSYKPLAIQQQEKILIEGQPMHIAAARMKICEG